MNKIQEFNQLKATAKELGINTNGMKKEDIIAAIAAKTGNEHQEQAEGEVSIDVQADGTATVEKRKPGRPVIEGSARQTKLAAMNERAAANGGQIKLGRPVDPTSPRQVRLAEIAAKREAAGGKLKAGRPKMVKPEVTNITVEAPAPEVTATETVTAE